jgi:hypothetical protein
VLLVLNLLLMVLLVWAWPDGWCCSRSSRWWALPAGWRAGLAAARLQRRPQHGGHQ